MSITLLQVIAAAQSGQVSLVGEMVGYLVLGVADQVVGLPRRVNVGGVELGAEGALRVAASEPVAGVDCEADLRRLMSRLLDCSRTATSALTRCSHRVAGGDIECLVRELETALIPVNRSAGRRVLARLFRETQRAVEIGSLAPVEPRDSAVGMAGIPEERGDPSLVADPVVEAAGIPEERGDPSLVADPVVEVVGILEPRDDPSFSADRESALAGAFGSNDAVVGPLANPTPAFAPLDHTVALEILSPSVPAEALVLDGDDLTDRVPEAWTPTAFWMEPEAPPLERTAPLPLSAGPAVPIVDESVGDFEIEVEVDVAIDDLPQLSSTSSTPRPDAPGEVFRGLETPLSPVPVHEGEPGATRRVCETTPILCSVVARPSVCESTHGLSTEPQGVHKEPASPAARWTPTAGVAPALARYPEAAGIAESSSTSTVEDPHPGTVDLAESGPLAATSTDESPSLSAGEESDSRSDEPHGCEPRIAGDLSPVQEDGFSGPVARGNPTGAPEEQDADVNMARRRVEEEVVEAQLAQAELRRAEIAPEPEESVEWIPVNPPVETRTPAPVGGGIEPWDEQPVLSVEVRPTGSEPPKRTPPTRVGSAPPVFAPRRSDVDELLRQFASGQSDDEIRSSLVEFAEEFSSSVPVVGVRSRCARATNSSLAATNQRPGGAPTTEQGPPRGH